MSPVDGVDAAGDDGSRLVDNGYVVVRRVLSTETCDALREHVSLTTDEAAKQKRTDLFGNIQEADRRYDLKLDLCQPVVSALNEFGVSCSDTLRTAIPAGDIKVVELAAITSDGGAVAQPVHADTMHGVTRFLQSDIALPCNEEDCDDEDDDVGSIIKAVASETALIYTALFALQDIEPEMGPTHLWPGTHTVAHHATLWSTNTGGKLTVADADEAFGVPHRKMTLKAGDLVLYDSRTMHCGGANCSEKRRSVFCISVMGPGIRPDGTTWTLLKHLRGHLSLRNFPLADSTVRCVANTKESEEIILPDRTEARTEEDTVGTSKKKEKPDGEWKPVPPLDDWAAAVQCSTCRKWRPCEVMEAPKFAAMEHGFQCSMVGFSCMQDQGYSSKEIDAIFS